MGHVIQGQRKDGAVRLRAVDVAEWHGYFKGIVKAIVHHPGCRNAPRMQVAFCNPYRFMQRTELLIAAEGIHTGQFENCSRKAQLNVSHVLSMGAKPEGTIVCRLEDEPGDRGSKVISSANSAVVGVMAGRGRTDRPTLKPGRAYHKYNAKRNGWPSVQDVARNPGSVPLEVVTSSTSANPPLSEEMPLLPARQDTTGTKTVQETEN
uniref:Large ribosomal subunit protein uL2 n=1 Tax=Peromyscus maniculatus bairdii TaxID=230844 RepID=A0A8C8W5E6_PERMB